MGSFHGKIGSFWLNKKLSQAGGVGLTKMSKPPFVPTKEYCCFRTCVAAWHSRSPGLCSDSLPDLGASIHRLRIQVERIVQFNEMQIVTEEIAGAVWKKRISHV
jgi:hypothetical protein